jgi:hypothetical protein
MRSHRSTHDSGIKRASYYSLKKLVRSPPRVAPHSKIQCSWMQQWQCTAKCRRRPYVLHHTVLLSQSRVTSWCVENGARFICAVFCPNHDLKSCLAYAWGFRYDIENGALHVGWYTEMPPLGNIVDLGQEWPRSTMFPRVTFRYGRGQQCFRGVAFWYITQYGGTIFLMMMITMMMNEWMKLAPWHLYHCPNIQKHSQTKICHT